MLPTAYEEVWTGISGTGVIGAASKDTLGYRNTFGGLTVSLATTMGAHSRNCGGTDADWNW